MTSRQLRTPTICGHRATGRGAPRDITGFRARGSQRRMRAHCGLRVTGDSTAGAIASTTDFGGCTLVSIAALTMALDTSAMDTTAATGITITTSERQTPEPQSR